MQCSKTYAVLLGIHYNYYANTDLVYTERNECYKYAQGYILYKSVQTISNVHVGKGTSNVRSQE